MKIPGFIDPHVHCRDGKQAYKETIRHASEVAKKQGIAAFFDMPNTDPPIVWEKQVDARLKLAAQEKPLVEYYLYIGLTANKNQISQAAELVKKNPKVVGLKLYAGHSVGDLGVVEKAQQANVYKILSKSNYKGVLVVHCEKENRLRPELWNPAQPWTHCLARPTSAEIASIKDQIRLASDANFKGNLHICHVSCPESVDLIQQAKKTLKITCGVTPHHILFTDKKLKGKNGLLYKVNPPLRDLKRVRKLRQYLKNGKIDWIETDHAPHTLKEKLNPPYLSGIANLQRYKRFLSWLNKRGMSWKEISKLTYSNIIKVFGKKKLNL